MRRWLLAAGMAMLFAPGCSLKKMTAGMTVEVAKDASRAMDEEGDYDLASAAVAGNLKFLEGLVHVVPDSEALLELLARGFASYAFAFLEEAAAEAGAAGDEKRQEALIERAIGAYTRAGTYGLRLLGLKRGFDQAWAQGGQALEQKLAEFGKEEVGRLFWTAYAWGGAIHLGQDRVENLALLPKVVTLMKRVLVLDETYYFGGAHLFMGAYYMSLPAALGGNPGKAREHFEKAIAISGGKALLGKLLYAQMYAAKVGDKALLGRLLKEVAEASADALPAARLANVLAKRKAARLAKGGEDVE
jgi:hypothetical protein